MWFSPLPPTPLYVLAILGNLLGYGLGYFGLYIVTKTSLNLLILQMLPDSFVSQRFLGF